MKSVYTNCVLVLILILVLGMTRAYGGDNASNPLAAVNNTDFRLRYSNNLANIGDVNDFFVDGSYLLSQKFKIKYELHYQESDLTGSSEKDWESFRLMFIYFATQGMSGTWRYKLAFGTQLIVDFNNTSKGIGSGSDQFAPFIAMAFVKGKTVLIPLMQHFLSYSGPDVNTTAIRLIAIQSLPKQFWGKLDVTAPIDWQNDNIVPASAEVQIGKMLSPKFGIYGDVLRVGIGSNKPYDWGLGIGMRFSY